MFKKDPPPQFQLLASILSYSVPSQDSHRRLLHKALAHHAYHNSCEMLSDKVWSNVTTGVIFVLNSAGSSFLGNSQGGNSTQATCGSSLGTIENSETLSLVVGLVIMFILVIYSRLARVHLTVNHSNDVQYSNLVLVKFVPLSIEL